MINLYDILDAADGQLFGDPAAQLFTGFVFDPRNVSPGDLFVAIKTERGDGHHYMQEALKAGAAGLMCTHPPDFDTTDVTVMIMRDVEAALMRWTSYIVKKFGTTIIGVTGSKGKSTTCNAIAHVLGTRYQVLNGQVDLAGRFGLPLALSHLTSQHEIAVLEYAPTRPGELSDMLDTLQPTIAVVTNLMEPDTSPIGQWLYNDVQAMFSRLPAEGLAVFNYDDPRVNSLRQFVRAPQMSASVDKTGSSFGADLTAYNLVVAIDKTGFDLRYGGARHVGKWVPLLGAHQLYASLMAMAVGLSLELTIDEALEALKELQPLPGRMNSLGGINGSLLIDDTANGDSRSIFAALDWLAAVRPTQSIRETQVGQVSPHGKLYVVVGEYNDAKRHGFSPRDLADRITDVASYLVTEGESASELARHALDYGFPLTMLYMTFSPQDSAQTIRPMLTKKDVILVTGNSRARMERVVAELLQNPDDHQQLVRYSQGDTASAATRPLHHTWLEIDIDAVAHNTQQIKKLLDESCSLMAVVKANAYGHGMVAVATTALLNGASMVGVGSVSEAVELRQAGLTDPIMVLGYVPSQEITQVIQHNLIITLFDQNVAREINRTAKGMGKRVRVHVRVDLNEDDLGLPLDEMPPFFRSLIRLDALQVEGVYCTLGTYAFTRLAQFKSSVAMLRASDFPIKQVHVAGSAATLTQPDNHMDMVRCGRALLGIQPDTPLPADFLPALSWKTMVVQVKRYLGRMVMGDDQVPMATEAKTAALLPVGYLDGMRWGPKTWEVVLLHNQRVPVIGQIGAYHCMVDISGIDDVRVGDEVVLIGKQGDDVLSADEVAAMLGTRGDELVSAITARLPRIR